MTLISMGRSRNESAETGTVRDRPSEAVAAMCRTTKMKNVLVAVMVGLAFLARLWAEPGYLSESDRLNLQDSYRSSVDLLTAKLPSVSDPAAQAAIYWRLSRDIFDLADALDSGQPSKGPASNADAAKSELLGLYQQSEQYADRAIELAPQNAKGYYWKAACVGKIAQTRNLVRAFLSAPQVRDLLFKAGRLAPGDGEIWYVLAQLYSQIPGFPISFGDSTYAVSLGRKGLDARKNQVADGTEPNVPEDYYVQLARELVRRNWSKSERMRRQPGEAKEYRSASDPVKKSFYYEGVVDMLPLSDREEAIEIDRGVVSRLESVAARTRTQQDDLWHARHDLAQWTR